MVKLTYVLVLSVEYTISVIVLIQQFMIFLIEGNDMLKFVFCVLDMIPASISEIEYFPSDSIHFVLIYGFPLLVCSRF